MIRTFAEELAAAAVGSTEDVAALVRNAAVMGYMLHNKSVQDVIEDYTSALERMARDVWRGRGSAAGMTSDMKKLIKKMAEQAFLEGLVEGGLIDIADAREFVEDEEEELYTDWATQQVQFVDEFTDAVEAVNGLEKELRGNAQQRIMDRILLWASDLDVLGSLGRAAAQKNRLGVWVMGEAEVHCDTCQWLDGQKHRLKWFIERAYLPRKNGSPTLECKGFRCTCEVVDPESGERLL